MSNTVSIRTYKSLSRLITYIRDDFISGGNDFVLVYAYNGTGKTRLSMEFKEKGKGRKKDTRDTLYFNAFTEDLFYWDNDLDNDTKRKLHLNTKSAFFDGFQQLALEGKIRLHLQKYADFNFKIDYDTWTVNFSRTVRVRQRDQFVDADIDHIKVSRGEENLFIWCTFLAICELAIDQQQAYNWVRYIYIDDPISSLDDNNVIALASDLAKLLRTAIGTVKIVISTHHGLFFNIICNELKKQNHKSYFLYRNKENDNYQLQTTGDTPFFYHVAMLKELKDASDSGKLYTYHFNMLRSIMEKTASFFGATDFSFCISGLESEVVFTRALNLLSHGQYSVYDPKPMLPDNKKLFTDTLTSFLKKYPFQLPNLEPVVTAPPATAPTDLQDTQP